MPFGEYPLQGSILTGVMTTIVLMVSLLLWWRRRPDWRMIDVALEEQPVEDQGLDRLVLLTVAWWVVVVQARTIT